MAKGDETVTDPIRVESLTVRYGRAAACEGVSLAVATGGVYALLGRNGAGKSSLIRCLLGEQKPISGHTLLFGTDSWTTRKAAMARTGVVPEEPDAPPLVAAAVTNDVFFVCPLPCRPLATDAAWEVRVDDPTLN